MSESVPGVLVCDDVLEVVYLFLDEEGEIDRSAVEVHLSGCVPCRVFYAYAGSVMERVGLCCGCDPVPPGLRDQVLLRIRSLPGS